MHSTHHPRALFAALMIAALAALSGCASKKPGEPLQVDHVQDGASFEEYDPFEHVNRGLFKVHEVIDGVFLKPMAHIYLGVVPEIGQTGIRNVLTNMASPVVLLNSVLQVDTKNAERTLGRFAINSTVGIAGIFDVATRMGIPRQHEKDFGQTMGVYGVGTGPYIMIPILGPSDARDLLGLVADIFSDPFTYILTADADYAYEITQGLVKRTDLLPLTDRIERDSLDPYSTYRSIYLQHRYSVIVHYKTSDTGLENEK